MEGRDEQDVLEAAADYLAIVKEFDTWFGEAYVRDHLEAVEAFLATRAAAQEVWRKRIQPPQDDKPAGTWKNLGPGAPANPAPGLGPGFGVTGE